MMSLMATRLNDQFTTALDGGGITPYLSYAPTGERSMESVVSTFQVAEAMPPVFTREIERALSDASENQSEIAPKSLQLLKQILCNVTDMPQVGLSVYPDFEGGISARWKSAGLYFEVEVDENQHGSISIYDRSCIIDSSSFETLSDFLILSTVMRERFMSVAA